MRLEAACRNLIFISETDSSVVPIFEVSETGMSVKDFVAERISGGPVKIEEGPAAAFFEKLTSDRDWHSPEDTKRVRRYRRLENLMVHNLVDVRMFRAGRVRIEIFVIGRDAEGNMAGVRTLAVET